MVAGNVSMEELLAKYTEIEKNRSAIQNEKRTEGLQALRAILESDESLKTLRLIGYTPYFNDGDPCVHRQREVILNGHSRYGEEDEENLAGPKPERAVFSKVDTLLNKMFKVFNEGFDTNWQIDVKKNDDGSFSWTLSDYDPGY